MYSTIIPTQEDCSILRADMDGKEAICNLVRYEREESLMDMNTFSAQLLYGFFQLLFIHVAMMPSNISQATNRPSCRVKDACILTCEIATEVAQSFYNFVEKDIVIFRVVVVLLWKFRGKKNMME